MKKNKFIEDYYAKNKINNPTVSDLLNAQKLWHEHLASLARQAKAKIDAKRKTIAQICAEQGISKTTYYNRQNKIKKSNKR